jgi:hypothetical protein
MFVRGKENQMLWQSKGKKNPSEVVAEHGPAVEIKISHKPGKSSLTSKHRDGHTFTDTHSTREAAHAQGSALAKSTPGKQAGAKSEEQGFAMDDLV